MSESLGARGGTGPLQPAVIRLYNSLAQVYRIMRERQKEIDAAFDRVAAQIGFIATTTLPVRVEVAEGGAVKKISFDGEALRGTIFEKELSGFLGEFTKTPFSGVPAGSYRFYLIWYDALNLKLGYEWCEWIPLYEGVFGSLAAQQAEVSTFALVRPEVKEPPHWFDPGIAIAVEDVVVILAIDEAYPQLRLVERIKAGRLAISQLRWGQWGPWSPWGPGPREMLPVYFSERFGNPGSASGSREPDLLAKVRAMLGK